MVRLGAGRCSQRTRGKVFDWWCLGEDGRGVGVGVVSHVGDSVVSIRRI